MNRDGSFNLSKSWKPLLQKLKDKRQPSNKKIVIPSAHTFIYTLPLSLFTNCHHSHTDPLPIGYHYLLPPPTQPTLPLALPLSCAYPTGINTLLNPATDILHPPAYEDGTDKEFRNIGYQEPDFIHLPMKMEPIRSSETSATMNQTPGNHPKKNSLQQKTFLNKTCVQM